MDYKEELEKIVRVYRSEFADSSKGIMAAQEYLHINLSILKMYIEIEKLEALREISRRLIDLVDITERQ
jgi:hypothetical protein